MEMSATNPFAALSPKPAGPCAVVIFGCMGNLARRKLYPALADLAGRGPA